MANFYAYRPGRSFKNTDPQAVGLELERIRAEKEQLRPPDVVEAAADPASPLHAAFEWDNEVAAQKHRLTQAGRLIVSVRVINGPIQANVPAFISVRTPERGRDFVPTVEALSDDQIRARVLLEVQQFIEALQRRYAHFQEAAGLLQRLKQQVG